MKKKTRCANCGTTVAMTGRFRFRAAHGDYVCVGGCQPAEKSRDGLHKNWPLVTREILGPNHEPMVINNLRQLRQVEKEHGISSGAYSYDSSNQ